MEKGNFGDLMLFQIIFVLFFFLPKISLKFMLNLLLPSILTQNKGFLLPVFESESFQEKSAGASIKSFFVKY